MNQLRLFSFIVIIFTGIFFTVSCNSCQSKKDIVSSEPYEMKSPSFNADSAYKFVERQVDFGPRVPGTIAHEECGDYLVSKLDELGASVIQQRANVTHYDGQNIEIRNIIGIYNLMPKREFCSSLIGIPDHFLMKKLIQLYAICLFLVQMTAPAA